MRAQTTATDLALYASTWSGHARHLDGLETASEQCRFFAALSGFMVVGRKPSPVGSAMPGGFITDRAHLPVAAHRGKAY